MKRCDACQVDPDKLCLGDRDGPGWSFICEHMASGEPARVRHALDRCALPVGSTAVPESPATVQVVSSSHHEDSPAYKVYPVDASVLHGFDGNLSEYAAKREQCPHFSRNGTRCGCGTCKLGRGTQGQVSVIECAVCLQTEERRASEETPEVVYDTPNLFQRGLKFSKAILTYAIAGMPNVSDEVFDRRMALCLQCPHYDAAGPRCLKCTCGLQVKARMATEQCPLQPPRWGPGDYVSES